MKKVILTHLRNKKVEKKKKEEEMKVIQINTLTFVMLLKFSQWNNGPFLPSKTQWLNQGQLSNLSQNCPIVFQY